MQVEFEESSAQPGDYQCGCAILYFGLCMAYTLGARGEGVSIPEGVQTHVPMDAYGRGPAFL